MPTLNLAEWSLDSNLFEREKVAGPVPSLFAEDHEASMLLFYMSKFSYHSQYYSFRVRRDFYFFSV